jgi:hypothetical protein
VATVVLIGLLAWPLAAFGGRALVTAIPFSIACILYAIATRRHRRADSLSGLERALLALCAVPVLQLIPLPPVLLSAISPQTLRVQETLALAPWSAVAWRPLSIDARATAWAALVTWGSVALFFAATTLFSAGHVRRAARGICALGFVFAAIAIAQAATAGRMIYWRFPTEYEGPLPFGPFVNRNHFATWAIMAAPLCFGYIAARAATRDPTASIPRAMRARIARSLDGRTAWLAGAGTVLVTALLVSLSRSGIAALALAIPATVAGARTRLRPAGAAAGVMLAAVVLALAAARADLPALAGRWRDSPTGIANRMLIWENSARVFRAFPVTGTGAGTYGTSMYVYQGAERNVHFNQAHNHYLQAMTEGGLLLVIPLAWAMTALVAVVSHRVRTDRGSARWLRLGAACGLLAVALQSVWETGLLMPANAALAAVLAAIAVHHRSTPGSAR